jgi:NADPH:quinone reductase-like Zn-dependent oxidoreductase
MLSSIPCFQENFRDALKARQVETGALRVHIGRVFQFDQIAEANRCMEENSAGGKIAVLTS